MILFLDACVLIYWMETTEPFYSKLMAKLRTFYQQDSKTEIAVSRLSHLECLVKPLQADDQALLNNYRAYFASPGLRIVELNSLVMEQAGHDHRLDHSNLQESQLAEVDSDAKEGAGRNDDHGRTDGYATSST